MTTEEYQTDNAKYEGIGGETHLSMASTEVKGHDMPSNFVIVIGRQFGSGGRTIGKIIARRLGIGYYDTELLKIAARSEGVSPEVFKDHDEKKPSVLKAILQGAYGIADNFHNVPLSGVNTYNTQCKVIKDICSRGSCVIVGRNADCVMRNHPFLLSVFLHAPIEHRTARIMERDEAKTKEAATEMALQNDKRRESYYNFYTGEKKWGVAGNYDLCLDTSRLDNESVASIIIDVARIKFGNTSETRSVAPH